MKILSISYMPIWLWGEGKGIPSTFYQQREFANHGFETYFVCPAKIDETKYSLLEGIHIYRFDFPFNFKTNVYLQINTFSGRIRSSLLHNLNWLFYQIFAFCSGLKFAFKIKPDVIYAHSLNSVMPAYLVSVFCRSKFVIRVYGAGQLYWKWDKLWYRIKEFRDYLCFKVPADYFVITNDGNYGNRLAIKLGVSDERIRYWRNGIDYGMFEPDINAKEEICRELSINPSSKIIVSTCRLVYFYGVDQLINSLIEVFARDEDSICLIAGSGPMEKELKEIVCRNKMESRIRFLGIVERKAIKKILNASDIFVFLSRFHNCTNTVWEAMACGKCIVTTETEAIKEVLTNSENAVLLKPDNMKQLPAILVKLLDDDNLRNEYGKKTRVKAREILEPWAVRIGKEIKLLEELVCKK